ncbi:hypothetical protein AGMMS50229_19320 [Campylobacterota bacterium]|nr:hypothetical protein AGMMS50229_19320 [Campylobacterota bacterium]
MDRIDKLERAWFKYKFKAFARLGAIGAVALFIVGGCLFFALYRGETRTIVASVEKPIDRAQPRVVQPTPEPTQTIAQNTVEQSAAGESVPEPTPNGQAKPDKPPVWLEPGYGFERALAERIQQQQRRETTAATQQRAQQPPPQAPTQPQPTPAAQAAEPPKPTATIRRVSSLDDLLEAYNKQPSYAKAVDIAEAYLSRNEPQNAYSWAIRANELNGDDERSWAVFATASYKLGYKDRAINALSAYLSSRNSDKLSKLLRELKEDKPKESL